MDKAPGLDGTPIEAIVHGCPIRYTLVFVVQYLLDLLPTIYTNFLWSAIDLRCPANSQN